MIAEDVRTDREAGRRDRILEAAERAFARHGFRGARMQDVAAEARMSAGNLYRYFTSKDAIVSGLVARDRAALTGDFQRLAASDDLLSEVEIMLRRQLADESRERIQLILEIWAEAARNPHVAELCSGLDRSVREQLAALLGTAKTARPEVDPDFVARVMATLVAGLFKRRVTDVTFDVEAEIAMALGVFRAALAGGIRPLGGAAR